MKFKTQKKFLIIGIIIGIIGGVAGKHLLDQNPFSILQPKPESYELVKPEKEDMRSLILKYWK